MKERLDRITSRIAGVVDGAGKGRVLVVRGGALGDFILTLPSVRALLEAGWEVELLTRPAYGKLAVELGWASAWRDLGGAEVAELFSAEVVIGEGAGEGGIREWVAGFDRVISWVPDGDGAFQRSVRACGVAEFLQGDWRCQGAGLAALQLGAVLESWGLRVAAGVDLFERMAGSGVRVNAAGERRVGFHPGSGSVRKNWPLDRWLEMIGQVDRSRADLTWLVVAGEAEAERMDELRAGMSATVRRWEFAENLDLRALAERLRECVMFFGHDSGVSHLAAACGVECRLLYLATEASVWGATGAAGGKDVRIFSASGREGNGGGPDAGFFLEGWRGPC